MLKKQREKIVKELEEEEDAKEVIEGDYINIFKRIGYDKSVIKTLNVKPDYIINELEGAQDYVFIVREFFDVFKTINKFLLFKNLGVPLDFKKLIFYIEEDEELYINEEKGIITTENKYSTNDLWKNLLKLVEDAEQKLQKIIILRRTEGPVV